MFNSIYVLHKLFEVTPGCSDEELRKSYCRLLRSCHPDLNPASIETATLKTQRVIAAYESLKKWRQVQPTSPREPIEEQEGEPTEVETVPDAEVSFSSKGLDIFSISLDRIAMRKQELRDAWKEFGARQYDIKAALRLVRAAFQGGRPDVVDDLVRNAKLVDAASILADIYSPDEAGGIALIWAQRLRDSYRFDLAIQLLEDMSCVAGTSLLMVAQLRDTLRSIHYGIAQGHFPGQQKPSPTTRILHLRAIVNLGFELGYVYKLLAEAFHEMGNDDEARSNLQHAFAVDPQLTSAKTIMRALGLLSEERPRKDGQSQRTKHAYSRPEQVPSVATIVGWFEHEQWDQIIAHADPAQYSPRILPSARWSLRAIASVLGECSDARAISSLLTLLQSVYWDVRQSGVLALAKIGGESELARLRKIRLERGENDKFVVEPVAYAEVRLIGTAETVNDEDVVQAAEALLRTYSNKYSYKGDSE